MVKLLPERVAGWTAQPPDRLCDKRTIYDYMDGAAEVYMAYAYAGLVVRTYRRPDQPDIIVELFDMTKPFDALGVFSNGRDEELPDANIGQGAEHRKGLLMFWQDRYFVAARVDAEDAGGDGPSDAADKAVIALGRRIARAIGKVAPLPSVLGYLPKAGRVRYSERCFCSPGGLNYHYDLGDANPLAISPETPGVLATYRRAKARFNLLCVQYPTAARAARARRSFSSGILGGTDDKGAAKNESGLWAAVSTCDRLLVAALDAPTRDAGLALIDQALQRYRDSRCQSSVKDPRP
jgi:hypothetical protein